MIPVCRYPGCRLTYAGDHTPLHPVHVADTYHDHVVREATAEDIAAAKRHASGLISYRDRYDNVREGYLVRYEIDGEGNEYTVALTDREIAALVA